MLQASASVLFCGVALLTAIKFDMGPIGNPVVALGFVGSLVAACEQYREWREKNGDGSS